MKQSSQGSALNRENPEVGASPAGENAGEEGASSAQSYGNWESFNILIESKLARYLYDLGGGDLSKGVTIAGKFHRANT
jgi:hypothetical protein